MILEALSIQINLKGNPTFSIRGEASAREVIEEFEFTSNTILVTSGGIRANEELILRKTSYNYSWLSFI